MKHRIAWFLAALLLFSLCACGAQPSPAGAAAPAPTTPLPVSAPPTATPEPAPTETPAVTDAPTPAETPSATEAPAEVGPVSPLLWEVTDAEGHKLYLFGTIHVGDERSDAVLARVSPVLERCDALAVEFDIVAYTADTKRVIEDMAQYVLGGGSVVSDFMPEALYQRAFALLKEAGLHPALFKRYNLAMWAQLVESAMLTVNTDLDAEKAMDNLLIRHAYDKEIPVLEVESSDFQMALLNSFDDELYLLQIEEALDRLDTYADDLSEVYELWLSGDKEGFWALLAEDGTGEYPEDQLALIEDYNRRMLDDRNLSMRDRALEYLKSGDTVFFAVGSAHMAGETGLVRLLTDAGCAVEALAY